MAERHNLVTKPVPAEGRHLEAALAIARGLAETVETADGTVSWSGDDLIGTGGDDFRVSRGPVGVGMYAGLAGIGWFLAHAAAAARDERIAEIAIASLGDALTRAHDGLRNARALSLSEGASGIALAAVEGAEALDHEALRRIGIDLALRVGGQVCAEPEAAGESDLIGGLAGVAVALLAVHRRSPHESLAVACREAARVLSRLRPDQDPTPALCGLAHGASGPAWALAETSWSEGDRRLFTAALRLLDYERSRFNAERCAWPDLREPDRQVQGEAEWPGWTTAWCHGALGIGAVRLRLYEATHDLTALAEATAAIQAARVLIAGAGAALHDGVPGDVTLCHGLAGAAELLLLAHEVTGLVDHLRAARRVGDLCLAVHAASGDRWTCGLRGATVIPGLFLGQAGIGATLLRLHDPGLMGSPALPGRPRAGGTLAQGDFRRSTEGSRARRTLRRRTLVPPA